MNYSTDDHMTGETYLVPSNPTFEAFPIMSQHHPFKNENLTSHEIHDKELKPVEYLDPIYMDVSMKGGNTNY